MTKNKSRSIYFNVFLLYVGIMFVNSILKWKGFPMKTSMTIAGMEIVMEVVEFTEDAFILPQTFEIPEY